MSQKTEILAKKNIERFEIVAGNLQARAEIEKANLISKLRKKKDHQKQVEKNYQEERDFILHQSLERDNKAKAAKQRILDETKKLERKAYIDYKKHIREITTKNNDSGSLVL